jgi:hypothetical protein
MSRAAVAEIADQATQVTTPWFTVGQAAKYSRYNYETVRRACVAYQRDQTRGLRCTQEGPNAHYRIHVDDLDRWVERLPPRSGRRATPR